VLDRSKARTIDQGMKAHVEKAVKSRSSGIDATLRKYNEKLVLLKRLQLSSPANKNSYLPPLLSKETIMKLDIDQDLWHEYIDVDPGKDALPSWMVDANVRESIRCVQEGKNCDREIRQLSAEHANIQQWLTDEYQAYASLLVACEGERDKNVDVGFLALDHLHGLYQLSLLWQDHTKDVPCSDDAPPWPEIAPPQPKEVYCFRHLDIQRAALQTLNDGMDSDISQDDDEDGELEPDEVEENGAFTDAMAALDVTADSHFDAENSDGFL
jgi:hypothetical protein